MTRDAKGKPNGMEFKSFNVRSLVHEDGSEEKSVEFNQSNLREFMRNNISIEDVYDDVPVIPVYSLFNVLDQIKHRARHYGKNATVKELVTFLESENKGILSRAKNMLSSGHISFNLLKSLFSPGTEVEIHGEHVQGGRIVECNFKSSFFGSYLEISYDYMSSNGRNFLQCRENIRMPAFSGVKEVNRLPIRPLTEETKKMLTERGEMYVKIATGSHYMQYRGHMEVKKWWSWDQMRSDGRIMVDTATYGQFVEEYRDRYEEDANLAEISAESRWMTEPYIKGFSFTTKQWGRFAVSRISDIVYRDDAFDQLVLSEDKKELVHALVTNGTSGFSDIISGKGGGCIFLLHGEPGVGKTLTAEAISELLHRPLYSVSVGELGTNTEQLEKSLRQILDVAQIWNAVVLIDEADIFLEKRTSGDILRNAMVGIFLRLLEYHQGVLFLTTNRVTEFDSAFHSRISIALKYGKLTQDTREKIWTNLLAAANITGLAPAKLSETEINGRQIKTTIRLAQGLANQKGVPVSAEHIRATLAVSQQFQQDLKDN